MSVSNVNFFLEMKKKDVLSFQSYKLQGVERERERESNTEYKCILIIHVIGQCMIKKTLSHQIQLFM